MRAQLVTATAEGIYSTVNLFETVVPPLRNFPAAATFAF
jgi:protein-L-isoaspartate(D-aspartate) O-methyltransferase